MKEYLIEIKLSKDTHIQSALTHLNKNGINLDRTFIPKPLKIQANGCRSLEHNFLVRGTINTQQSNGLKENRYVANYWQTSGNIPF